MFVPYSESQIISSVSFPFPFPEI